LKCKTLHIFGGKFKFRIFEKKRAFSLFIFRNLVKMGPVAKRITVLCS